MKDDIYARLPSCIRSVLNFLLLDMIEPTDSFAQILRKIVVTVGACMFVHPVSYIGYFAYLIANGAPIGGPATLIVACAFSMISWLGIYIASRFWLRNVPDVVLDVWLSCTNIAFTLLILSMPQYPATTCVFASGILTILCGSPRRAFFLGWCALMYLLKEYNDAVFGSGIEALVPGFRVGPLAESLVNHMSGFFIAVTVLFALLVQTNEHVRHVEAASAAVETAQAMARQLARYDTNEVQKTILQELERGHIDADLLDAFAGIADNLERYKPHLPNWVIDVAEKEYTDPDMQSIGSFKSAVSEADSQASGVSRKRRQQSAAAGSSKSLQQGSRGLEFDTDSSSNSEFAVSRGSPELPSFTLPQSPLAAGSAGVKLDVGTRARVCIATICVARKSEDSSPEALAKATDAFMAEVLGIANATQASIHSFLCDTLEVSWNATHRVSQTEMKACRFMARLRAASATKEFGTVLRVSGAVMATDAVARFAGAQGGQRTLHVTVPPMSRQALHALSGFACQHGVFVADGMTAKHAQPDIICRDVEALSLRPLQRRRQDSLASPVDRGEEKDFASASADTLMMGPGAATAAGGASVTSNSLERLMSADRVMLVSEIMKEVGLGMDEWMYVLNASSAAAKAEALVSTALRCAISSDYAGALKLLDDCDVATAAAPGTQVGAAAAAVDSDKAVDQLARRLRRRIERSLQVTSPAPFPLEVEHPASLYV